MVSIESRKTNCLKPRCAGARQQTTINITRSRNSCENAYVWPPNKRRTRATRREGRRTTTYHVTDSPDRLLILASRHSRAQVQNKLGATVLMCVCRTQQQLTPIFRAAQEPRKDTLPAERPEKFTERERECRSRALCSGAMKDLLFRPAATLLECLAAVSKGVWVILHRSCATTSRVRSFLIESVRSARRASLWLFLIREAVAWQCSWRKESGWRGHATTPVSGVFRNSLRSINRSVGRFWCSQLTR